MADQEVRAGRAPIQVPLEYVGIEQAPLIFANSFLAQTQQDEFILYVGQVMPPIVIGTRDEQIAQLRQVHSVQSHTVARIVFTRARLDELIGILEDIRQRSDQARMEEGE